MRTQNLLRPLVFVAALAGCSDAVVDAPPVASASAGIEATSFHFVRVVRDASGYVLTPLDAAKLDCGDLGATASCSVVDLNLTTAEVARDEAGSVLADITAAADRFSVVLVGRVVPQAQGTGRIFEAYEVWTSDRPVPVGAPLFHVNQANGVSSVALGSWAVLASETLERTGITRTNVSVTPPSCGIVLRPVTLEVVEFALATAAGALLAGTRSKAAFVATDAFVRRMPDRSCDHNHGRGDRVCCGPSTHCETFKSSALVAPPVDGPTHRPPPDCKDDHILGGIDFEYERSTQVAGWLATTHQPISTTAHAHAPLTP